MKRLNAVYGAMGGALLYIPFCFLGYIPLLFDVAELSTPLLVGGLLASGLLTFFTISYRYESIKLSLFRTVIMLLSLFSIFAFCAQTGIIRWTDKILCLDRDAENIGSGLFMAVDLSVVTWVGIITNIIIPLWKLKTRNSSTQ